MAKKEKLAANGNYIVMIYQNIRCVVFFCGYLSLVKNRCKQKENLNEQTVLGWKEKNIGICISWQMALSGIFFCGNFIGMSAVNRQKCWNVEMNCTVDTRVPHHSLNLLRSLIPSSIVVVYFCLLCLRACYVLQILCIFNRRETSSKWMRTTNARATDRPTNQITSDHPA